MQQSIVRVATVLLTGVSLCLLAGTAVARTIEHQARPTTPHQRRRADIAMAATTTRAQVVARWGEPVAYGPARTIQAYEMDSGERLWLSFSPSAPHGLTRALLVSADMVPHVTSLFNTMANTKTRQCKALDFAGALLAHEVDAAWGPPDNVTGSGIENWEYKTGERDQRLPYLLA